MILDYNYIQEGFLYQYPTDVAKDKTNKPLPLIEVAISAVSNCFDYPDDKIPVQVIKVKRSFKQFS